MWGKWGFPTSHDPLHIPWNYGCEQVFSKKIACWTWTFFVGNIYDACREDRRFYKIHYKSGVDIETPRVC